VHFPLRIFNANNKKNPSCEINKFKNDILGNLFGDLKVRTSQTVIREKEANL
jgi:hypothetical protein